MGAGDGEEVETCRICCGYNISGDENGRWQGSGCQREGERGSMCKYEMVAFDQPQALRRFRRLQRGSRPRSRT